MNTMKTLIKSVSVLGAVLVASASALACGYGPSSEPPVKAAARTVPVVAQAQQPGGSPTNNAPAANPTPSNAQPQTTQGQPMTPNTTTPATTNPSTTTPAAAPASVGTKTQLATFGAGCFWGVEEFFRTTKGVVSTRVGYAGGATSKPTYKDVCEGDTNHAEVVEITFDPAVISYEKLVGMFFKIHDPTQVNRQGPDYGTQYRTVIFYHSPEQKAAAETEIKRLTDSKKYKRPIATQVVTAPTFWSAEDYHQQYFFKRGIPNTCHIPSEE
ncbi:MAG: peptide-methionine (S)-S-oxide reductase MsrA [Phycisphaerales bacterium]